MSPDAAILALDVTLDPPRHRTIDTCHNTWEFDEAHHRFRRLLRHDLAQGVSTEWRPYARLVADASSDAFVVVLEPRGTRVLVGRRCGRDCHCRTAAAALARTNVPVEQDEPARAWAPGVVMSSLAGARVIPLPLPATVDNRGRSWRVQP